MEVKMKFEKPEMQVVELKTTGMDLLELHGTL